MRVNRILLSKYLGSDIRDQERCTGRSTGLALAYIGEALRNPGKNIKVADHIHHHDNHIMLLRMVVELLTKLELRFFTINDSECSIRYDLFVEV